MIPFSPLRFRIYAEDLSKAVLELSRERMGATSYLRQRLGVENVRVRLGGNRQFITMTDDSGRERTVEVNVSASDDEIARALNLQKINELTTTEQQATPLLNVEIAPVVVSEPIKKNLTGASFLANLIRTQQAAIKKQLADAGTEMTVAMSELQGIANEATNQVKAVKAETADLKAALGLNSNGEPV